MAIEAVRADYSGADLVLLDDKGEEQDTISEGFWTRPLAWSPQGDLIYLTTACASTLAQDYNLFRRTPDGEDRLLMAGITLGGIGSATAINSGIAYVTGERAETGIRGTSSTMAIGSSSTLWFWNLDAGTRGIAHRGDRTIMGVTR